MYIVKEIEELANLTKTQNSLNKYVDLQIVVGVKHIQFKMLKDKLQTVQGKSKGTNSIFFLL